MSNMVNNQIRERAIEAAENCTNSMLGSQLNRAIEDDDLELMQTYTQAAERHHNYLATVREDGDIY